MDTPIPKPGDIDYVCTACKTSCHIHEVHGETVPPLYQKNTAIRSHCCSAPTTARHI